MRLRWWRRRREALVCREAVALMGEYLDGALSAADRARLEDHLAACPHCSEHLAQLRVTIDALGRATPEDLSDDAVDDLVAIYRRWQTD
jgi:anti-sigma factor RsiW